MLRATPPMTRVVHLTSVHPQPDVRILVKECGTLAAAGYDVTLVAPGHTDRVVDGIPIRAVQPSGRRLRRMTGTVAAVYETARSLDAELYHFHDPELLPVGVRLHALGKRAVYDVHEDLPRDILGKDWIAPPLRRPVSATFDRLERALARRLDAVVAAGSDIAERFAGLGIPTVMVGNYPDVDPEAAVAPWPERERAVCYVGGITRIRGLLEMIDAAELAGVRLVLAGRFAERRFRDAAVTRSGWRGVEELGYATRAQVAEVYSRVRAGLVVLHPDPNFITGYTRTTKLFEYMAAGLPVIASDFPGWRALVEEHGCGICVDPLDPAAIAGAIGWVMDNPEDAERMGQRGREAVLRHYTWAPEARKLLDLYASLLR